MTASVVVGMAMGVLQLRHMSRTREMELETRQLNIYIDFLGETREMVTAFSEVIYFHEWKDYDEWLKKYGPTANPEAFAKLASVFAFLNGLGLLVKNGILNIDVVSEQWGGGTIEAWDKLEPIVKAWRKEGETNVYASFEYLYNEVRAHTMPQYVVFKKWIATPERPSK